MSRQASRERPSRTRVVLYQFVGPFNFDIRARLERALKAGTITQWDDGRGDVPWFEGPPGKSMRVLRDEFISGGGLPYGRPYTHPEQRVRPC